LFLLITGSIDLVLDNQCELVLLVDQPVYAAVPLYAFVISFSLEHYSAVGFDIQVEEFNEVDEVFEKGIPLPVPVLQNLHQNVCMGILYDMPALLIKHVEVIRQLFFVLLKVF
jgi:hypothetical protein